MITPVNNKKGFSLVEIMVSVALLAIISAGLATSIILSRQLIDSAYKLDEHSAKAQKIADALVLELPNLTEPITQVEVADIIVKNVDWGASYTENEAYQFKYTPVVSINGDPDDHAVDGYRIQVAVYYSLDDNSEILDKSIFIDTFTDKGW